MSNETDLDWLARNVHVWVEDWTHVRKCQVLHEAKWMASLSPNAEYKDWRTKEQWLTRRAKLHNKPSWDEINSSINYLSQCADGQWIGHHHLPEQGFECFECDCEIAYYGYGEILGCWQDTLEKRPEEFKSSIEEANRMAQEFKPFTSIEDNHGHEMKQDNGWFKRGELPPVGVVCEAYIDYPPQWVEAEIVAHKDGFAIGWCKSVMKGCHGDKASEFRPIRTERDVLIEIILSSLLVTTEQVADAIIAAGFKLEAK